MIVEHKRLHDEAALWGRRRVAGCTSEKRRCTSTHWERERERERKIEKQVWVCCLCSLLLESGKRENRGGLVSTLTQWLEQLRSKINLTWNENMNRCISCTLDANFICFYSQDSAHTFANTDTPCLERSSVASETNHLRPLSIHRCSWPTALLFSLHQSFHLQFHLTSLVHSHSIFMSHDMTFALFCSSTLLTCEHSSMLNWPLFRAPSHPLDDAWSIRLITFSLSLFTIDYHLVHSCVRSVHRHQSSCWKEIRDCVAVPQSHFKYFFSLLIANFTLYQLINENRWEEKNKR